MRQTIGKTGAIVAVLCLAALTPARVIAQKKAPPPPPPPLVIDTEFAALDRSLWKNGAWFSVPAYHALGEQAVEKVMIRRRNNTKAKTWESGLEVSATARGADTFVVKIRLTLTNPNGNHDKTVTTLVEVMQGEVSVRKATIKMEVESGEDKNGEATLTLPADLLSSQPPLGLRLTMKAADS